MSRRRQHVPAVVPIVVIGDDPQLLAQVSTVFAQKKSYLPLLDGPRFGPQNIDAEVARRNNAIARVSPHKVIFAGLPSTTCELFSSRIPPRMTIRVADIDELRAVQGAQGGEERPPVLWGPQRIGIGLLQALRSRATLVFNQVDSPSDNYIRSLSDHLIVCEDDDALSQVIAANYAFSLDASLVLMPAVTDEDAEEILENFYSLNTSGDEAPTSRLGRLFARMRNLAGELPIVSGGSVTFITKKLPWGVAFQEVPSTHLFSYPDLGISIINGITAEQPGTAGISVATLIDPQAVDSKEVEATAESLARTGVLVRGLRGAAATVHRAHMMTELLPYDLLLISTHCGDVTGWRWTYEFIDSEGIERVLVVDVGIGVASVPGDENLHVTQFTHFVSLDGIDWNDRARKEAHYVGRAILDYVERLDDQSFRPTKREDISRVLGSAALKMFDNNYIPLPRSLASEGTPIVINNACASWHRLAATFTFGNARAYVGTLYDVLDPEAQAFMQELVGIQMGKPLAAAIWQAQRRISCNGTRRPYVLVGCHFQRLRTAAGDAPLQLLRKLNTSMALWERMLSATAESDESRRRTIGQYLEYLRFEIAGLRQYRSDQRAR